MPCCFRCPVMGKVLSKPVIVVHLLYHKQDPHHHHHTHHHHTHHHRHHSNLFTKSNQTIVSFSQPSPCANFSSCSKRRNARETKIARAIVSASLPPWAILVILGNPRLPGQSWLSWQSHLGAVSSNPFQGGSSSNPHGSFYGSGLGHGLFLLVKV